MSKTVHPYSFRVGVIRRWRSRWFSAKDYRLFLKADILIRDWLKKKMKGMYVESVVIERTPEVFHVILKTSRPGLIIGRKGEGAEKLKKEIRSKLAKLKLDIPRELKLTIEEIRLPETHASIVAQMVADSLEKRFPFRRVMKQMMEKIMANKEVLGAKISLSGRLGGAEMSRKEYIKKGRIPLQTLRADIDFAKERANLPYGVLGIKVWIYKGDKFSKKQGA